MLGCAVRSAKCRATTPIRSRRVCAIRPGSIVTSMLTGDSSPSSGHLPQPGSAEVTRCSRPASAFDGQRGILPVLRNQPRSPDVVAVAKQISELRALITDLGTRSSSGPPPRSTRPSPPGASPASLLLCDSLARCVRLGAVAHQLAFPDQTEHLRDQPDAQNAREAAVRARDDALSTADMALRQTAASLHVASVTVSPPSVRLRATRSWATTAAPSSVLPPLAVQASTTPPG